MEEAKKLAKTNRKSNNGMASQNEVLMDYKEPSEFLYDTYEMQSKVIALIKDGVLVDSLDSDGYVILDKTCFYATSGGQVADLGGMKSENFKAKVIDCIKAPNGQHLHKVELVEGSISKNEICTIK